MESLYIDSGNDDFIKSLKEEEKESLDKCFKKIEE